MSTGMGAILPLRMWDVSFVAGGRRIIDRVSVDLLAGPSTIVLGANGAGKSVLMRLMHGLIAPSSGEIAWLGGNALRARRLQAMVFQRPVMLRRSAFANIVYALALAQVLPGEREVLAREALESVGLWHLAYRPARVLSGGEQQRLALARALARDPEILFLDEPTASLDPAATKSVEDIVRAIAATGVKIVMATHDIGQARRLAGDIVFLARGRLVERADAAQFFASPSTPEGAAFLRGDLVI